MKVYVASSWRNPLQPNVVRLLREFGHEVYDFRTDTAFRWSSIDPNWTSWKATAYRQNLQNPLAQAGFKGDLAGMNWADVGILLLPAGRSAHLELGWMAGRGKKTIVWTHDGEEPELMALLADRIAITLEEVLAYLQEFEQ